MSHTRAPWGWFGNSDTQQVYLATVDRGRQHVMTFDRWGMQGGQPRFNVNHIMVDGKHLLKYQVGDPEVTGVDEAKQNPSVYRRDILTIDHPDASVIAASADLLEACEALIDTYDEHGVVISFGQIRRAIAKAKRSAALTITDEKTEGAA